MVVAIVFLLTRLAIATTLRCSQSRLLLIREIVSLQGFATIPGAHGSEFLLLWVDDMLAISDKGVMKLAKNAMHAEILFLIWLWFLSCSIIPGRTGDDDDL